MTKPRPVSLPQVTVASQGVHQPIENPHTVTGEVIFSRKTIRTHTHINQVIIIDGRKVVDAQDDENIDVGDLFEQEVRTAKEQPSGEVGIVEPMELAQALEHLNSDDIQPGTRMSAIDMRANLHQLEISGILAIDSLVGLKFLSVATLPLTRQKKRLSVSLQGKGRQDIVALVAGKRDQEARAGGGSLFDGIRGMLGGKKE